MQQNNDSSEKMKNAEYPLTVGQKGRCFLNQLDPLSDRNLIPRTSRTFKLSDNIKIHDLEKVLEW